MWYTHLQFNDVCPMRLPMISHGSICRTSAPRRPGPWARHHWALGPGPSPGVTQWVFSIVIYVDAFNYLDPKKKTKKTSIHNLNLKGLVKRKFEGLYHPKHISDYLGAFKLL